MHIAGIYPDPDQYNQHHKLTHLPKIKMRFFPTIIVNLYKNVDSCKNLKIKTLC